MNLNEIRAALAIAIEADVARAAALAKDLNIARPPLIIKAPSQYRAAAQRENDPLREGKKKKVFQSLFPRFLSPLHVNTTAWKVWKFIVLLCMIFVTWYYPYRFAFTNHYFGYLDYFCHIFDVTFACDFVLDVLQPVYLPHSKSINFSLSSGSVIGYV